MYDLAVLGGGFWGTACAYEARKAGLDTILVDDENPEGASRNSAGIACLHWYKQETIKKMWPSDWSFSEVEDSFQWLQTNCGLKQTGEDFFNMPTGARRYRDDCYLIPDNSTVLDLTERCRKKVSKIYKNEDSWVVWSDKSIVEARRIIIAMGAYTDELLRNSEIEPVGVRPLFGRAMILSDSSRNLKHPLTVLVHPYVHYTLRPWMGNLRWGDTTERKSVGPYVLRLEEALEKTLGEIPRVVDWAQGVRPVCDTMTVKLIATNAVVAVGGHRVGLGISGLVAKRALDLLS